MRHQARRWLEMADRIHDFRRDVLKPDEREELEAGRENLRRALKEKADAKTVQDAVEKLEKTLRRCGGKFYPASSMVENVEFFLVAAIVILGLRAYFVQPFKIPTNSMWPTYYGMTAEVFSGGQEPSALARLGRLATLGASHYSVEAPADGEVQMAIFPTGYLSPAYIDKPGRSLLIFPTPMQQYAFRVNGEEAHLTVPADFRSELGKVFDGAFRTVDRSWGEVMADSVQKNRTTMQWSEWQLSTGPQRVFWVPTGRMVKKGEKIVSFDILTGDLLFVDRISYHFFPPKVGSGFVFKTGRIDGLNDQGDRYFVKRLVGVPGDTMEIRRVEAAPSESGKTADPRFGLLYRNGAPISGAHAFEQNARQEGLYPGYRADGNLAFGQTLEVPEHSYFALGDNSPNSRDGRSWGFVPEKDVVGRPLFIYYPLTKRWGPTR